MRNKRLINNRKGFTLVELLGVIVIIGVMMGIAIPTVTFIINKTREKYYTEQTQLMVEAAQSYYNDNPNEKPKEIGQSKTIKLEDLYNLKYIKEKIKDKTGKICYYKSTTQKNSYVKIYKYNKNDYSYEGYLNCPACEGDRCKTTDSKNKPIVTVNFDIDEDEITEAKLKLSIDGNNSNLSSYSYKIYANGILVKNSGVITTTKQKIDNQNISISEYLPSKFKIIVTATNKEGLTTNKTVVKSDYVNLKAVQVGKIIYSPSKKVTEPDSCHDGDWIKEGTSRKVSVQCLSNKGTGCAQEEFYKSFNKSINNEGYDTVPMQDAKGKKFNAIVYTCIDGDNPYVESFKINGTTYTLNGATSATANNWYGKENIKITSTVKDNMSGINKIEYYTDGSKTYTWTKSGYKKEYTETTTLSNMSDGTHTRKVVVYDNVGNSSSATLTFKVDKLPPSCGSISGESTTWTDGSRNISIGCNDSGSGCVQSSYSKTVTAEGKTANLSFEIADKAGNVAPCTRTVNTYIDKTDPSCGSWSGESTSWATSRTLSVGCSDSTSGCISSSYSKTITSGGKTADVSITISDKAGNTSKCTKNSAKTYIDNIAPSCGSFSGGSTSWTSGSRTISVKCSDDETGCTSSSFSKTLTSEGKTEKVSIEISDKAGNTSTCTDTVNKYIDKSPPTITNTYVKTVDGTYGHRFYLVASDPAGLKKITSFKYCYEKKSSKSSCSGLRTCAKNGLDGGELKENFKAGETSDTAWGNVDKVCALKIRTQYKLCDKLDNCTTQTIYYSW